MKAQSTQPQVKLDIECDMMFYEGRVKAHEVIASYDSYIKEWQLIKKRATDKKCPLTYKIPTKEQW